MAYGTPRTPAEILPYYTDIRRGKPPSDEQLADLTARYEAIGGTLSADPSAPRLNAMRCRPRSIDRADGRYHVVLGLKHAAPFIEQSVEELAGQGFRRIVGLVLAPHYSAFSIGQYLDRLNAAATAARHRRELDRELGNRTRLRRLRRRRPARASSPRMPAETRVVFTAHSLPQRIVAAGDPYPARAASHGRVRGRRRRARPLGPGLAERRPHAGAVARSPTSSRSSTNWQARRPRVRCWSVPSVSSPTISKCSTTSTSKPPVAPRGRGSAFARTSVRQRRRRRDARPGRPRRWTRHDRTIDGSPSSVAASPASPQPTRFIGGGAAGHRVRGTTIDSAA